MAKPRKTRVTVYDPRSHPQRGVHVKPLPHYMHAEFSRFMQEFRHHAQSHYSTWRLAAMQFPDHHIQASAIFWRSAVKLCAVIEAMGVRRAHSAQRP